MGGLCGASRKRATMFVVTRFIPSLINPYDQTCNTPAPSSNRRETMMMTAATRAIARTTMTAHRREVNLATASAQRRQVEPRRRVDGEEEGRRR